MKQHPRDHPRPAPASERPDNRPSPRSVRDAARRPDRSPSRERRRRSGSKPRPARELSSAEETAQVPVAEPDVEEAHLDVDGRTWTVRVVGRSGRAAHGEAPLLLLGFWDGEPSEDPPQLEFTVVGRTLDGVGAGRLRDSLAKASPPPSHDRKTPFFESTHQGKRR